MDQSTFTDKVSEYGSDFTEWIQSQELNEKEETIWLFQYWLRTETDLSSGSIVDYRKYVAEYLNQQGELMQQLSDLTSHEQAAVNKFQAYNSKTSTEGDKE